MYRPILDGFGLTYPQYLVLLVLWEHDEAPTVSALGERLHLDSGTLSPLLKRLEGAGLVVRRRSTADERRAVVELTAQGRALRERMADVPQRVARATGLTAHRRAARHPDQGHRDDPPTQGAVTSMQVLYTAYATATGDGRDGHVRTSDATLDLDLAMPKELGGAGNAANPEQLFAAGYAACFHSALRLVGRGAKADLTGSVVEAEIGIGPNGSGGFALTAALVVDLPAVPREAAEELVAQAHQICPYSNATRGNIEVALRVRETLA